MRLLLVVILINAISTSCKSQDVLIDKVRNFLIEQGELPTDEKGTEIYIADLLTNDKFDSSRGYFRFVILGSHQLPYVGYSLKDEVYFLDNYELKNSLSWFSKHLENEEQRTPLDKLVLLENFTKILKQRESIVEQLSTDQEIKY